MRPYLLSTFLHIAAAVSLFLLASLPAKRISLPQNIEQVFLMERVMPPQYSPVEEKAASLEKKVIRERIIEKPLAEPRIPEKSLVEKLQERIEEITVPKALLVKKTETKKRFSEQPPKVEISEEEVKVIEEAAALVELEPGFPDAWYITLLSRRLTENWSPASEGIRVVKREVVVFFTIDRKGRIGNSSIIKTSGNFRFDRSGLAAVAAADNLPPLPASWARDTLQVRVRFRER